MSRAALETNWNLTKLKRKSQNLIKNWNSWEKAKLPTLQSSFNWVRVRLKLVVETVRLPVLGLTICPLRMKTSSPMCCTHAIHTRGTSCCKRTLHVHSEIKHSRRDTGCSLASHFWNMPFPQSSPSTLAAFPPAPPFLSLLLFLSKDSAFSAVSSATNLSSGSLVYEDGDREEVD